jgi:hypothetical protein
MKYNFTYLLLCLSFSALFSQKVVYPVSTIPDSLKQNANAVIRLDQTIITISSQRDMNIKNYKVVTVFNENGWKTLDVMEYYDKSTSINSIDATVYNAIGNEIKKIKRKDFKDQTAVDGGTLISDARVLYLDYTPTEYPFTIIYSSELNTSNTAFIPQWIPLNDYYTSLEKSILTVNYRDNLGFKKKELNFANYNIRKDTESPTQIRYLAENILAQKEEDYSYRNIIFPRLMMGLELFNLEGVDGSAKNWKDYGKWYSEKILDGTIDLSEETKSKIKALIGDEKDIVKKIQIVYNFVQQKSRYVSIQVGIGGWKPMMAKDVDRLGYGDCKALSNYTKSLLNVIGIPSYNTILYGDTNKRNIQNDFVSMQGNHMILAVPYNNDYIWLECTSQDNPFGYQGDFTDDREVLIIKTEGGEIVHTKKYINKDNSQITNGEYSLTESGELKGFLSIVSEGVRYDNKYHVEKKSPEDMETHYKGYFDNINNLKINKKSFLNDKDKISFTEKIDISAVNYGSTSGNRMLFVVNAFNNYNALIKKIRNRKNPFEIQRGYYDDDNVVVHLPQGYAIEAFPNTVELNSKFGEYKIEFVKKDENTILYKRSLLVKKGTYSNKEYDEYRLYMEQINKNDNAKVILIKK